MPLVQKHFEVGARFPRLFRAIGELGKPTLCAANGHVLAGALGLALACDLIVAREGVRFGTPEINVGVFPFMIMALIYRNVGRKKTNELLLLGEQISAEEAERIGIVNSVVPAAEFDAAVADWAGSWRRKSPVLMRLGKDAMFRQQDMAFADALAFLQSQLTLAFSTEDMQEGVRGVLREARPGLDRPVSARVVVLRGRTSDRTGDGVRGAEALGAALAERLGVEAAMLGEPGAPRDGRWEDDLRDGGAGARGAAEALGGALDAGELPVLLASDCTIASRRCPRSPRREPDVAVVWLDAHGDFNTPATTASGFLGGMCLAAACGRWDARLRRRRRPAPASCSPTRATSTHAERDELERAGLAPVAPGDVADAVRGRARVPPPRPRRARPVGDAVHASRRPAGCRLDALRSLLADLADAAEIVGVEVTSMAAPAPAGAAGRRCCAAAAALAATTSRSQAPARWTWSRQ